MGAERKSQFIDQKEKLATAYHEVRVLNWLIQALLTVWVFRVDMPWSPCTPMGLCHCIKSLVSLVAMHWVMYASHWVPLKCYWQKNTLQTSQLPVNDRTSISFKEYLADIDVAMGGRVAEEISMSRTFSENPLLKFALFSLWARQRVKRCQLRHNKCNSNRFRYGQSMCSPF